MFRLFCFSIILISLLDGCADHSLSENSLTRISYRLISNTASSRSSAYIDVNKIVATSEELFFVYLDNGSGEFDVVIRKIDKKSGKLSDPVIVGTTSDNHGCPALAMDENGFLWIAMGGHSREMYLLKSTSPYDITSWEKETIYS